MKIRKPEVTRIPYALIIFPMEIVHQSLCPQSSIHSTINLSIKFYPLLNREKKSQLQCLSKIFVNRPSLGKGSVLFGVYILVIIPSAAIAQTRLSLYFGCSFSIVKRKLFNAAKKTI